MTYKTQDKFGHNAMMVADLAGVACEGSDREQCPIDATQHFKAGLSHFRKKNSFELFFNSII